MRFDGNQPVERSSPGLAARAWRPCLQLQTLMSIPIKSARDIEKMRTACRAASEVLARTAALVQPGATTGEVDRAAAAFMKEADCRSAFLNYRGFPGNICISVNQEVVHGIGGTRRVQYGDIVKLDVGVIANGWVGDTATTVAAGAIDNAVQRLLQVTEDTLHLAIPYATEGPAPRAIFAPPSRMRSWPTATAWCANSWATAWAASCMRSRRCRTTAAKGTGPRLKAGMVLAIEPMVNMGTGGVKILADGWTVVTADGKPSAHFEHTVLITKGEPEILTWREKTSSR